MLGASYTMPTISGLTITYSTTVILTGTNNLTNVVTISNSSYTGAVSSFNYPGGKPATSTSYCNTTNALPLGSLLLNSSGAKVGAIIGYVTATSNTFVDNNGNGQYIIDQAASTTTASVTGGSITGFTITLQNALQDVLNNPIPSTDLTGNTQYYKLMTTLVALTNAQNFSAGSNMTPASSAGASAIRLLAAMDDGTPIFDTGKCSYFGGSVDISANIISGLFTQSATAGLVGNTYVNFSKKIGIFNSNFSSNNTTVNDASGNVFVTGTAGGNAINENHQTRPEILLSLFSNNGVGFAQRWSSSTRGNNLYISQRIGVAPEANQGTIRLNVPITYSG